MEESWHVFGTLPQPTLDQIERQKRWEMSAVEEAIAQYRADLYEKVEHMLDNFSYFVLGQFLDGTMGVVEFLREFTVTGNNPVEGAYCIADTFAPGA